MKATADAILALQSIVDLWRCQLPHAEVYAVRRIAGSGQTCNYQRTKGVDFSPSSALSTGLACL